MMKDWNGYRETLLGRVGELAELSPDVLRGLQTLDKAAARTGQPWT